MMNSSTEAAVVRGAAAAGAATLVAPELRSGTWTRLGDRSVLGDAVTEQTLSSLAETAQSAARAQGYAIGWAEGRREAAASARETAELVAAQIGEVEQRRAQEHRLALDALMQAAHLLHDSVQSVCTSVEDRATHLAMDLTEQLVGHELAVSADPGADVIARVLALMPREPVAFLHLAPADVPVTTVPELAALGVEVVADPTLSCGDALLIADDHVVDLRVSSALDRLREVLA